MQELFNLIQPPLIVLATVILVKVAIKVSVGIKLAKIPENTLELIVNKSIARDDLKTSTKRANYVAKEMGISVEHSLYKASNIAFGVSVLYMAAMVIWWAV